MKYRRVAEHRLDSQLTSLSAMCRELVRDDLAVRVHEFRIVANRLDVQRGTAVLEPLVHFPRDASAKDLLDLTASLIRRRIPDSTPQALNRLRKEAAMLAYHGATLRQVFTDELDEGIAKRARDEAGFSGSLDQLGRARKAITEDPRLAGLLLDEFRARLEPVHGVRPVRSERQAQ